MDIRMVIHMNIPIRTAAPIPMHTSMPTVMRRSMITLIAMKTVRVAEDAAGSVRPMSRKQF
jgi:hypothetical protein